MCVCVCVCVWVYVLQLMREGKLVGSYFLFAYECISKFPHLCTYIQHKSVNICIYTYTTSHIYTYIKHTYIKHTYMHTYTHTHKHSNTQTLKQSNTHTLIRSYSHILNLK